MAGQRDRRASARGRHREEAVVARMRTAQQFADELTVIVPAYNEAESLADTVKSLVNQTCPPARVIVVDDGSTDDTGQVAEDLGVEVLRPPQNTGSKAGAQSFALQSVATRCVMAIDADTVLAVDAIEELSPAFDDPKVAAACGFVLPRHVRTMWERGRYVEYLYSFTFHKQVQDAFGAPLIASGCFSAYRTDVLSALGGWSSRTMAEDMDLTWSLYERGWRVRFMPTALCYPIEPHTWQFLAKQLRRWSHGFVQNIRLHWRGILGQRYLRSTVALAAFDATFAPAATRFQLPLLAIFVSPWYALGYVVDFPIVAIPVLIGGGKRGEIRQAIASLPCYFALRLANCWFMLRAVIQELRGQSLTVYEKGH
jgi:cellulose synthase/poly-beta-1,6-N-acetylglucosamine synthase-like glycosyltransferase